MEDVLLAIKSEAKQSYYGKFRGTVVDNEDKENLGRLRLHVPSVLGDQVSGWALPCFPFGGLAEQGCVFIPEKDAQVWVEFEEGDVSSPLWVGTFFKPGDMPSEAALSPPTTRAIKTPSGHVLQFDDEEGAEKFRLFHPADAEMTIDKDGTIEIRDASGGKGLFDAAGKKIEISDANGNKMEMTSSGITLTDANGNSIEMAASGVTITAPNILLDGSTVDLGGAGGEPVIKGQSFLTLFKTHIHPHPLGPTTPPVPQGEDMSLSMKTKTS